MAAAMAADAEEDEGEDVLELTEELAIPDDDAIGTLSKEWQRTWTATKEDISFAAPPAPEFDPEPEPVFDPEPVMAASAGA